MAGQPGANFSLLAADRLWDFSARHDFGGRAVNLRHDFLTGARVEKAAKEE